jgi:hypothetical protein
MIDIAKIPEKLNLFLNIEFNSGWKESTTKF